MRILLSNDDGLHAQGLRHLYHALKKRGHDVFAVAPATEQSARSSAITARYPLTASLVQEGDFTGHAVYGTPADSVLLALGALYSDVTFDLVLSGINNGPNLGVDVFYSGTVGAALQGAIDGIPSLAVSSGRHQTDQADHAEHTADLISRFDWASLPHGVVCNLNYPDLPLSECKDLIVCPHATQRPLTVFFERREDPRGDPYYWMENYMRQVNMDAPGMDKGFFLRGHITLTPLRFDLSDHALIGALKILEGPAKVK